MNNREKCHAIIDNFSDEQLAHIAVILDSVKTLVAWDSDFIKVIKAEGGVVERAKAELNVSD